MKITILTLFPEYFSGIFENTIIKRAISSNKVILNIINIRDYTKDKYKRVDSAPIGGGAGLIMKCQPIIDAIRANSNENTYKILLSPRGKTYSQEVVNKYKNIEDLLLICGHYEGIDERVNNYVDELISIGDFILTGGEIPAMAIVDSIVRELDGVISRESIIDESFENNLLEYPQYTEPRDFEGYIVPDILYSGNHQEIDKFRYKKSLELTRDFRPDLFNRLELSSKDLELLNKEDKED